MIAIPLLLAKSPDLKIIVASAPTQQGGKTVLNARAAGTGDCMAKPAARRLLPIDARLCLIEERHVDVVRRDGHGLRQEL
jgi:chemotaxis response regulator CheB